MLWICIVAPQSPSQFKCQGDLALQVASVRIALQFGPTIDHRLCVPAGRQSFSPVQVACRARCVSKCCLAGGNARLLPGIQHREALHAGDGFGMITCDVMRDGQIPVVPVWMQGIEPNRCVQAGDALVWLSTKGQHISKHRERIRIRRIGVYRLAGRVFGSVEFAAPEAGKRQDGMAARFLGRKLDPSQCMYKTFVQYRRRRGVKAPKGQDREAEISMSQRKTRVSGDGSPKMSAGLLVHAWAVTAQRCDPGHEMPPCPQIRTR